MSEELMRPGEGLFTQARRGYDRDEVDAYVSQLQHQLRDLQSQVQRRQTPEAAVATALDRMGSEVAEILKQANATRDGIIAEAEQEAAETTADAESHAARVTAQAETHAAQVTAQAESRAAQVTAQAEAHAAETTADAEARAAQLTAQAEAHAARVTSVAEQRVHELDLDTDRIWAERERIVADARDLARQLQAVADLAAERFPQDPDSRSHADGAEETTVLRPRSKPASGFDELNAGA